MLAAAAAVVAAAGPGASAWAGTTVQIGSSGKTYASSAVQCVTHPTTGTYKPMVAAGLFNPKPGTSATVSLNGGPVMTVTTADPSADVWLAEGNNTVTVALSRKVADRYAFTVAAGQCDLPDVSHNTFSADGTLEYAASGKSYATVTPGCAMSPTTGQPQPYVHLFDNGGYLLNVSVNGVPLTQLSALKTHTPVFLSAGKNVISAANGSLSIDYFLRDGGDGRCVLP
ncbi:MAG: hypothetical protein Q7U26_03265 [Aquabacterium sp.]|nr:hypothetical protein [Aquabacterium sp.]